MALSLTLREGLIGGEDPRFAFEPDEVSMSHKLQVVRQIADYFFPVLTPLAEELKPIVSADTTPADKIAKTSELLRSHTSDFNDMIHTRARRRGISRGDIVDVGEGDWKIYSKDAEILLECIKLWDYLKFRMNLMDNHRFARLAAAFDERRSTSEQERFKRIDASRFFSYPPAVMTDDKWDYWLSLATLTEEEAVALSLGKDPDVVTSTSLQLSLQNDLRRSLFREAYQHRLRALKRATASGELDMPLKRGAFAIWAEKSRLELPDRFYKLLDASPTMKSKKNVLVDEMNSKYRRTVRMLLLVMAVAKYDHKIDGNSQATKKIADAFEMRGLSIDLGTVKDALRDAASDESLNAEVATLRDFQRSS